MGDLLVMGFQKTSRV